MRIWSLFFSPPSFHLRNEGVVNADVFGAVTNRMQVLSEIEPRSSVIKLMDQAVVGNRQQLDDLRASNASLPTPRKICFRRIEMAAASLTDRRRPHHGRRPLQPSP